MNITVHDTLAGWTGPISRQVGILDYVIETLDAMPPSPLLEPLKRAFESRAGALADIENSFALYARSTPTDEQSRYFFHSWSLTNHSAMCVSGIGNRMTREIHLAKPVADTTALMSAVVSLNRISDEDLGVGGGTLHADMFYEMAELFCRNDQWMSRRYVLPSAQAFRQYKHHAGLKNPDLMQALLTTTVHEVYTHGEVEFILPLFQECADLRFGLEPRQRARKLAWISVHCKGTEQEHFRHSLAATQHYCGAHGIDPLTYDLESIFGEYLDKKAQVMRDLARLLENQGAVSCQA